MANRASVSGSVSATASSWASWCRKTFLGQRDSADEESEPLNALTLSSETEADQTQIEECPICTTAIKGKLCAAVPCKHEACERCWQAWQKQSHNTCMICAQPIASVNYPPQSRMSKNKGSHFAKHADDALEDALRSMLRVKNELTDIQSKMEEIQEHLGFLLQDAQAGVFDADAATSIVQVEVITTKEQLEKLLKTTQLLPDVSRSVTTLNRAMRDLDTVANSFADLSDWSKSTLIAFVDVISPISKEKRTALALQWKSVTELFSDLLTSKANIVQAMAMIMPMEGFSILGLLERCKSAVTTAVPPINEKVRTFEAEASKFMERMRTLMAQYPFTPAAEVNKDGSTSSGTTSNSVSANSAA